MGETETTPTAASTATPAVDLSESASKAGTFAGAVSKQLFSIEIAGSEAGASRDADMQSQKTQSDTSTLTRLTPLPIGAPEDPPHNAEPPGKKGRQKTKASASAGPGIDEGPEWHQVTEKSSKTRQKNKGLVQNASTEDSRSNTAHQSRSRMNEDDSTGAIMRLEERVQILKKE